MAEIAREYHRRCRFVALTCRRPPPHFLAGDTFIRAYMTVFDRDNNVVQFARSSADPPTFRMPDGSIW